MTRFAVFIVFILVSIGGVSVASAAPGDDFCSLEANAFTEIEEYDQRARRVVCAEVAALDQMLVYNRFGSHNPFGEIFALMRDLVPASSPQGDCREDLGMHRRPEDLAAGEVRLNDCKRPRPLTLRANVGDVLHVRLYNYLRADEADGRPGYSETFCRDGGDGPRIDQYGIRDLVSEGTKYGPEPESEPYVDAGPDRDGRDRLVEAICAADTRGKAPELAQGPEATDWPRTRGISFVIDGLRPLRDPATGRVDDACIGLGQLAPGADYVDCFWHAEREGPYFINSVAAAAGGEGDGGSLTHGLFGSLAVEPQAAEAPATQWYRSQTSRAAFDAAWTPDTTSPGPHDRAGPLDYEKMVLVDGEELPVLNILKPLGGGRYEIVHNALNAIIRAAGAPAFREFTVVFHDELKSFYTRNFEELARFPQLAGVRDGFAINYGASGLGAMVLANRKGIGPAADCMECLYEEFFLESWANGDPALLEGYGDDPSNVHHSYLNDPVVFRNYHAGPKETHVFHLHAHQWFGGNDGGRGSYLDSQTVAPRQGFTYRIYNGGLNNYRPGDSPAGPQGWWASLGSGNRNRTVGDSIFHCHLYPHFAQGMWELWRVHDVLEDGSRKLPDGQAEPGLSTELLERDPAGRLTAIKPRRGSVDEDGRFVEDAEGTPIPALVPLPDMAAPLLPTYVGGEGEAEVAADEAVPGFPFFVAGQPGHRAPQAPLDLAAADDTGAEWLDGGLPRHVVSGGAERKLGISADAGDLAIDDATSPQDRRKVEDSLYRVTAKMLALGDFSGALTKAEIKPLDNAGEPLERAAMAFHHNGAPEPGRKLKLRDAYGEETDFDATRGGYVSAAPNAATGDAPMRFAVNGAPPKPGAPFADPCGAPDSYAGLDPSDPDGGAPTAPLASRTDPFAPYLLPLVPDPALSGFRRYAASAVQVDIVTNKAGWHDPQGRINVLTSESDRYKSLGPSAREEPFFFRAYSGECVEFRHTNELPKDLELDDFQVRTPTDTIGQHIHLVKFDVTSGDGSGNGWNYEDGTFAADELATRLCAWNTTGDARAGQIMTELKAAIRAVLTPEELAGFPEAMSFCEWNPVATHRLWSLERSRFPFLFQTTVQRWFADPILSIEDQDDPDDKADRTMRTVFSHDHFGPSSIQQHGFYSALVIEPAGKEVCPGDSGDGRPCMEQTADANGRIEGGPGGVGTHKIVTSGGDPELHPDYREFALAIADFALLYDPTDASRDDLVAAAGPLPKGGVLSAPPAGEASPQGLATLVCEAEHRASALTVNADSAIEKLCNSNVTREVISGLLVPVEAADVPPAMVARDLIEQDEVEELRRHFAFVRYRAGLGEGFARPVSGPQRPEAISTDHHDPYLVNYRGEPVPLRIGEAGGNEADGPDDPPHEDDAAAQPIDAAFVEDEDDDEPGSASASRKTAFDCYRDLAPDMLAQFSRRDPAQPGPDGSGLVPPGIEPEYDSALEQDLAEAAGGPDCSIDRQSPDPRGNLAHAYRSEFFDDEVQPAGADHAEPVPAGLRDEALAQAKGLIRNRGHGDPATPLLETYSDERIQIRLIQGAQEVQHTFNLEGLQWRRQIDQKYPAASMLLDEDYAQQTWWQGCSRAGRDGIAGQHDRWRDGTLKAGDDLAYWDRHNRLVALCDNLESFVSAQEVGISEHFEIPAAPSKYAVQFREVKPAGEEGAAKTDTTASLDYMFHFGSQDAIWNGAWGLMRVYESIAARDETRRIEELSDGSGPCAGAASGNAGDCVVGDALLPLDPGRAAEVAGRGPLDIAVRQAMECPLQAPRIEAYAVAMPLPGGQQYASWRDGFRDPNGLALVHVPKDLVAPWLATGVPAGQIAPLRAAAGAYFRDEPMVIRANAGDCLRLSVVNALTSPEPTAGVDPTMQACGHAGNGDPGPMADCLGDAPMPKIVSLNVEPSWSEVDEAETGPRRRHQVDRIDIRPSARIAFTTPLSMLTRGGAAHLPFGVNRTTSEPPGGVQSGDYYMGLLRIDWRLIEYLMANSDPDLTDPVDLDSSNALQQCGRLDIEPSEIDGSQPAAVGAARAILSGADPDYYVLTSEDGAARDFSAGRFPITVMGKTYWGHVQQKRQQTRPLPGGTLENVAQMTVNCAAALLEAPGLGADLAGQSSFPQPEARPVSAIPYAFGAVPLKPTADLFNQLPHGLFGALVVEPQGARYPGRPQTPDGSGEFTPAAPGMQGLAHRGRGANTWISFTDADDMSRGYREFVLFYQDGLNLWDSGSRNRWWPYGVAESGPFLPIVDDCLVCDDTYDLGEKAVSYLAPAFHRRLRQAQNEVVEAHMDLNAFAFDPAFRAQKDSLSSNSLRLWARPGEEVVVRIVHPGGRARQRAFVTVGNDYDDLFPGFGFPHSGLVTPGKSLAAALSAPVRSGCYLWTDGPREIEAAGAWGLLDVLTEGGRTSCGFLD
ncbi:hypothetical protein [Paracoccus marinaquae]|uniref:Multicopper oxidase n=1 Tax=Paracoccus marinaquae TaxID=2841926 RepID=A0ABS6ANU6_9RHOB|nr:hypothetical protein [Paracoccus marinaquae]MBU3031101.1 hypothetical protein [Paracoccus marinaquae]